MKNQMGFTLLEVVITAAIVGILAAFAYPIYTDFIYSGRRTDAKSVLVQNAQLLERQYTLFNRYDQNAAGDTITEPPITQSPNDETENVVYNISFVPDSLTQTAFILRAVPTNFASQDQDRCGTLTLTSTGVKDIVDAEDGVTAAQCW